MFMITIIITTITINKESVNNIQGGEGGEYQGSELGAESSLK